MRRFVTVLALVALVSPTAGQAQNEATLADVRQELSMLYVALQRLKRELSTTGATGELTLGGSALERIADIESEMQRLTAKTEQLEFRIDSVVSDGTNRVEDLEFRLCELEPACDIATLEPGETLGGVVPQSGAGVSPQPVEGSGDAGAANGPQLAIGEESDFKAAEATLAAGDFAAAAQQFAAFQNNYPGGPLSAQAGLLRGEALEGAGDLKEAGRAYLKVFSDDETGSLAAVALRRVGTILGQLGQAQQACVTLSEVETRFPMSPEVTEARSAMTNLGCQ